MIHKALAVDPDQRYSSVSAFADALRTVATIYCWECDRRAVAELIATLDDGREAVEESETAFLRCVTLRAA